MARTKGVGFNNVRSFVTDSYGAEGWRQMLAMFAGTDREVLDSVVAMGWYDLGLYARLIRAIDARFGAGDLKLAVSIGRYEAEKDLTSIHQWLLRLVRPSIAIEQVGKYWRRFHDTGDWTASLRGDREINARLTGWGVVDAALCRELVGYLQRTLELLGAREVIMEHTRCRVRGEADCEFRALYRLRKDREEPGPPSRHGIDNALSLEVLLGRPSSAPPLPDNGPGQHPGLRSDDPGYASGPPSRPPPALRSPIPPPRPSTLPPPTPSSSGLDGPRSERWTGPPSTRGRPRR